MTDEKPVPETLETIAEQISALSTSMEKRFGELKAQLGVKIEAVDANVRLVYDVIITQQQHIPPTRRRTRPLPGGSTTTSCASAP